MDATLGAGGHAEALLSRGSGIRLLGLDRDPDALERARERLAPFGDRVSLLQADFSDLASVLDERPPAAGILADLGVSSMQLDRGGAGILVPPRRAARHAHGKKRPHGGRHRGHGFGR